MSFINQSFVIMYEAKYINNLKAKKIEQKRNYFNFLIN